MYLIAGVFYLIFWLFMAASFIYGLVLTFSASILLGALSLFFFPVATFTGVVGIFGHPELASVITQALSLPF